MRAPSAISHPKATAMTRLPTRTVHLDFHTGPAIDDVASNFKADEFAATFQQAAVQSVTVFAKCHHGHLYYETDRPERHPGLPKSLDLLGEQIDALHRVGIRAPIYLSLQVDEYAANSFPDWIAVAEDLRAVKLSRGVFEPGWQVLDMSSPYAEYFEAQLDEVLNHLGVVDGVFLDMCWDQPSASTWAISRMRATGLDPADAGDRALHARAVAHGYMSRYQSMIMPHLAPDAPMSVWFNSRPTTALIEEIKYVSHVEIEALPTGGWGHGYFPHVARFVAPLGVPMLAHTGRFHKSWGDSGGLKPPTALKYECCQMLAHGVSAGIGDLLHPRGRLEPASYELIGDAFRHLARCEPFVTDGRSVTEVAVLMDPALGDAPGPVGVGIVRALQQLRVQFALVPPDADCSGVPLVIIPETTVIDRMGAGRLDTYLQAGGHVLVAGAAGVNADGGALLEAQGVDVEGISPYSHTFLWDTAGDENQFPHVMYEPTLQLTARPGTEILFDSMNPYFERTWEHFSGHDDTRSTSHPVMRPSRCAATLRRSRPQSSLRTGGTAQLPTANCCDAVSTGCCQFHCCASMDRVIWRQRSSTRGTHAWSIC